MSLVQIADIVLLSDIDISSASSPENSSKNIPHIANPYCSTVIVVFL